MELTLREYLAGQAVNGLLARPSTLHTLEQGFDGYVAIKARMVADALIAELERTKELEADNGS